MTARRKLPRLRARRRTLVEHTIARHRRVAPWPCGRVGSPLLEDPIAMLRHFMRHREACGCWLDVRCPPAAQEIPDGSYYLKHGGGDLALAIASAIGEP